MEKTIPMYTIDQKKAIITDCLQKLDAVCEANLPSGNIPVADFKIMTVHHEIIRRLKDIVPITPREGDLAFLVGDLRGILYAELDKLNFPIIAVSSVAPVAEMHPVTNAPIPTTLKIQKLTNLISLLDLAAKMDNVSQIMVLKGVIDQCAWYDYPRQEYAESLLNYFKRFRTIIIEDRNKLQCLLDFEIKNAPIITDQKNSVPSIEYQRETLSRWIGILRKNSESLVSQDVMSNLQKEISWVNFKFINPNKESLIDLLTMEFLDTFPRETGHNMKVEEKIAWLKILLETLPKKDERWTEYHSNSFDNIILAVRRITIGWVIVGNSSEYSQREKYLSTIQSLETELQHLLQQINPKLLSKEEKIRRLKEAILYTSGHKNSPFTAEQAVEKALKLVEHWMNIAKRGPNELMFFYYPTLRGILEAELVSLT